MEGSSENRHKREKCREQIKKILMIMIMIKPWRDWRDEANVYSSWVLFSAFYYTDENLERADMQKEERELVGTLSVPSLIEVF